MRHLWVLLLAIGCRGATDAIDDPAAVHSVSIAAPASQLVVGASLQATAVLRDGTGSLVADRLPTWTSLNPAVAIVEPNGLITGIGIGSVIVRASLGRVSADFSLLVVNPAAASIVMSRDTVPVSLPGGSVQLLASARDGAGNIIARPTIAWSSATPLIARVNSLGLVTPVAAGTAIIRATMDTAVGETVVPVQLTPATSAPTITRIAPSSVLLPGGSYTLTGTNFGAAAGSNIVLVDGVPVLVGSQSATQMQITLPSSGFSCDPTHQAFIQITANGVTGGGTATLQVAPLRTLQPGQSLVLSAAAEARCNELALTGGRYLVSVFNATRSAVTPTALASTTVTLRGAVTVGGGIRPISGSTSAALTGTPLPVSALRESDALGNSSAWTPVRDVQRLRTHLEVLARNRGVLTSASRTLTTARPSAARVLSALSAGIATVGSITPVKLPNLDAANFCTASLAINARTAAVGPHYVILEDTSTLANGKATLAGQLDPYYRRIGDEFETVVWPLLTTNFGSPLAYDTQLGGIGKVVMVFSPRVNAMQNQGVLGYAVSCDLDPSLPSSNAGAFFYAVVPTSTAPGYANGETRDSWMRQIRGTIVHEVKHLVTFAERRARGLSIDPVLADVAWEEGMARIAEELFARSLYGGRARDNLGYATTIGCDLRYQESGSCADRPVLMLRHFEGLFGALAGSQNFTPLGRTSATDVSFYSSNWALLRWATDHFGTSESTFLQAFTTSAVTGVPSLEALSGGRAWEELLGEWSLAMYLDDLAAFAPANQRLLFPSWKLPDLFYGLCTDLGPCRVGSLATQTFPRPTPQLPRVASYGNFSAALSGIVGGGYALVEIAGTQSARQLLELRGVAGADVGPGVRLAIVRLQ